MEGVKLSNSPLISDEEENDNTTESGPESPPSSFHKDTKISTSKRSKRGTQKRVVWVPTKNLEGSRLKGENATPPSDSWAWRKYGQKPIKGSPYPRGYYRCSSWKGCPARKQVERSKVDPTLLVVTYSCEHNHPCQLPSRNRHLKPNHSKPDISKDQEKLSDLITNPDDFSWFGGIDATPSTILIENPICFSETNRDDTDLSMFFPIREEDEDEDDDDDESLFADLGELPECSAVFGARKFRSADTCPCL